MSDKRYIPRYSGKKEISIISGFVFSVVGGNSGKIEIHFVMTTTFNVFVARQIHIIPLMIH